MSEGVAIIGISGLYPEAAGVEEFYRNLCRGLDSVRPMPEERAAQCGLTSSEQKRLLAAVERVDEFDHEFFNISPKEAEYADPQQRWLLLLACAAIENAGYSLGDFRGSATAVVFSASNGDYRRLFDSGPAEPTAVTGNLQAALAGRTAYALDLQGPALVIDTACSSSLVAVYEASRKVLHGEADYALAGGINFFFIEDKLGGADIGIMAPDGKSKAFDDSANGTGFGEGGGVVLLKRLSRALADGDHIHAVIKGGAVNQDGGRSNGLTAPSPQAQAAVILRAWQDAGVEPETIGYIEAHGTGTRLGDPIEIQGITDAFRKFTGRRQFCHLGSVKTNIGHLVSAAGIAGLTKCVLSLRHKQLFPSLHFREPNGLIDFENSPVVLNTQLREWRRPDEATPLRCGVSSFGLSGTNAHLVLEEAPPPSATPARGDSGVAREELVALSAKTPAALLRYVEGLRRHLQSSTEPLADIAYTLNAGRDAHPFRYACVVRDKDELLANLEAVAAEGADGGWHALVKQERPVVFLFSGDAAAAPGVCDELAQRHEVFAQHYRRCLEQLGERQGNSATAVCGFQFALYHLWRSMRLGTDKLIGTGAGNKAVAALTGRLTLAEALEEALRETEYAPLDAGRLRVLVAGLSKSEVPLFLEMGAGGSLSAAVGALAADWPSLEIIRTLAGESGGNLAHALARLYLRGASFSLKPFYEGQARRRVELPTYPFEKRRFWVGLPLRQAPASAQEAVPATKEPAPPRGVLREEDGTACEQRLASIWGGVLSVSELGRDDDYFDLGGDSLSGTQLTNAIAKEFGVRIDFEDIYTYSTIRTLGQRIAELSSAAEPAPADGDAHRLTPVPRREQMPLSSGQQRLWFLHQLEPDNPFYNIPVSLRLKGRLETPLLEGCLREIVRRHEVLRTVFVAGEGRPAQVVREVWPVNVPVVELQHLPPDEREPKALRIAAEDARAAFSLTAGPLLRVTLIKLAEDDHLLQVTMHHIVSDGWSVALLVREFAELYRALGAGETPELPALPVQYADYSVWQQHWLESEEVGRQLDYWKRQLGGRLPVLELPADRPRRAAPSYRGARHDFDVPPELTAHLHALGQRESATLFMILLAAFQVLLARYTGEEDIIVGTPIAGRNRAEIEKLIGFFTNTLVLRNNLGGDPDFASLLREVKRVSLEAYSNQDVPFELLVEGLQPKRVLNRTPLFQVMLVLQNISLAAHDLPGLGMQVSEPDRETAKFDVTLFLMEREDGMAGRLEYSADLFDAATAERMAGHLLALLRGVVADPLCKLSALPLLTEAERRQLAGWNQTHAPVPEGQLIHRMFEQRAALHPERLAVIAEDRSLTFAELNERANRLAHYLRGRGVGPESRVALLLSRTSEVMTGLLAVLKAGAAYVPVDTGYPRERIDFMLEDAGADIMLVGGGVSAPTKDGAASIRLDGEEWADQPSTNPSWPTDDGSLAYVIYTSGTTGRPKGVMIQHRSVVNLFHALEGAIYSSVKTPRRVGVNASLAFDASVKQWIQLAAGRTLCLLPEAVRADRAEMLAYLNRHQVDVVDCTPAIARFLLGDRNEAAHAYPTAVLVGGEAIDAAAWAELAAQTGVAYFNVYGPTECTVDSTQCRVQANRFGPTIGRPLSNVQTHVLDRKMNPTPVGVTGELYVGGAGLARGYWKRAGLTAASFVPDPFSGEAGARMYRTGDLARYRRGGELEYAGRADRQVTVRGHRIELAEVERVLGEREGIAAAAVVARRGEAGDVRLVAFVVRGAGAGDGAGAGSWEEYVRARLPEAMRPWVVRELGGLPLTANGKVDREELERLALAEQRVDGAAGVVAARDEVEGLLTRVWEEVLGATGVGVHDNFFDLGGDSILSIQIVAKVNQAGLSLKPRDLFEHQTIAELAGVAQTFAAVEAAQGIVTGEVPLTPIQHWFFEQSLAEPAHWNQSVMLEVRRRLDPKLLAEAVVALCRQHDALRLRFTRGEDGWRQSNDGWSEESAREVFSLEDVSGLAPEAQTAQIERRAAEAQRGLNLERGPLWRVVLFGCGPERPQRLLLTVHHLAVDGVSWRILLEDLRKGYADLERGVVASLGRKTTSFKRWAEELQRHAQSPEYERELAYWRDCLGLEGSAPATDFDERDNSEQGAQTFELYLTKDDTRALLHRVQSAARANVNELLLAALSQAWGVWGRGGGLRLMVEGHGREYLAEALDVSRTVGWFTKVFPVRLETVEAESPERAVRLVQETLQSIPREGLGFGLLRYMNQRGRDSLRGLPLPEVSFNYLGQFDHLLPDDGWFALARESAGPMHGPLGARPYKLEIGGGVAGGVLQLICRYHEKMYRRESVEALAQQWLAALRRLIAHYCELEAPDLLLEELADEHLSSAELANILEQLSDA